MTSLPPTGSPAALRPCAFFDRDGVLNRDVGYAHRPEQLDWMPGAQAAVKLLNDSDYLVIVVTNQAGVARGYYTEEHVEAFHACMQADLGRIGARIDAFYACPYHEDGVVDRYRVADHPDRKPNPGMILRAFADWPIRRAASFLVGDRQSDIAAASAAGLRGALYAGGDLESLVRRMLTLDGAVEPTLQRPNEVAS